MSKFTIYQLLPRLFGNTNESCVPNSILLVNGCGKFNDITEEVIIKIKELGITHIWYTGIIEHATCTDYSSNGVTKDCCSVVKGVAGSPYAIKDYYDVDPDLAVDVDNRMEEFENLISRTHTCGLKVIIDFVPNHVARQYVHDYNTINFPTFNDNNYYILDGELVLPVQSSSCMFKESPAKATGNDCFSTHPTINDWYDTVKLNYNKEDTWLKMAQILDFWASKGVDGFRCDMAEMVPVSFWKYSINRTKERFPDLIFIAEIYNPSLYRDYLNVGGFDYLYDKVGLYDTLKDVICNRRPASDITKCWQSVDDIQNRMLNFLENHDEQRIASDYFAIDPQRAIPAVAISLLMNKAPFMIYFGQELGERGMDNEGYSSIDGRTSIFDYWSVKTIRNWIKGDCNSNLRNQYKLILNLALADECIKEGGFYDLQYAQNDGEYFNYYSNYAFIRYYKTQLIIIVANFSNESRSVKLRLPKEMFDHCNLVDNCNYKATDLMSDKCFERILNSCDPYECLVDGNSVSLIKFSQL